MPDRSLLEELKHRKVYRVAAIYAGAAFVVWQVADIALPTLGAPEWVMQLIVIGAIVGFPIALALAWLIDLAPGGARRLRIAVVGVVGLALIGGAAALIARVGLPGRTPDPSARTLAVLPFHVRGSVGLAYLRDGLVDLLSRNLQGADLNPIDPSAVMKAAGGEGDDALTPEDASRLARSIGAGQYVLGSVTEAGGRVRMHATLYELGDSLRAVASGEAEGDTLQLFAMVDELTAELLAGRSSGEASRRVARTAATTTSSIEALKLYLEGERSFRVAEHADAVTYFARALEEDSAFALARFRMAMSHALNEEHGAARREVELLTASSARLGDHDRRVLEAFAAHETGRLQDAERLYRAVVRDFPADVEAKVLLASLITTYSVVRGTPANEATPLLDEIEALDPEFLCINCMQQFVAMQEREYERLAWLKLRLNAANGSITDTTVSPFGDLVKGLEGRDEALIDSAFARADAHWPDEFYNGQMLTNFSYGPMVFGRFDLAERAVEAAHAHGGDQRAIDWRTYEIAVAKGRRREAAAVMSRMVNDATPLPLPLQAQQMLGYAWLRLEGLEGLRARVFAWQPPALTDVGAPDPVAGCPRLLYLGLIEGRLGELRAGLAWADSLDARLRGLHGSDSVLVAGMASTLRADLAWRAGDPERALALLERVSAEVPPDRLQSVAGGHVYYASDLRAYVALDAGRFEEALRWFRYGSDGVLPAMSYGEWNLGMARTLEGLGREEEAAEHYARVVEAWTNADPELAPQLDYARRRLTAINIE